MTGMGNYCNELSSETKRTKRMDGTDPGTGTVGPTGLRSDVKI